MTVRKTTLAVDDELLAEVAAILGTRGIKETIDSALHGVLVAEGRRRVVEQLVAMDGLDIGNPQVMAEAWRE